VQQQRILAVSVLLLLLLLLCQALWHLYGLLWSFSTSSMKLLFCQLPSPKCGSSSSSNSCQTDRTPLQLHLLSSRTHSRSSTRMQQMNRQRAALLMCCSSSRLSFTQGSCVGSLVLQQLCSRPTHLQALQGAALLRCLQVRFLRLQLWQALDAQQQQQNTQG
jgi:hypothetical protein